MEAVVIDAVEVGSGADGVDSGDLFHVIDIGYNVR